MEIFDERACAIDNQTGVLFAHGDVMENYVTLRAATQQRSVIEALASRPSPRSRNLEREVARALFGNGGRLREASASAHIARAMAKATRASDSQRTAKTSMAQIFRDPM